MPMRVKRVRRRILCRQIVGAFGLSFVFLAAATGFSTLVPEPWQTIIARAFFISGAAALTLIMTLLIRSARRARTRTP
jgi:hypothetical protein